MFFHKVIILIQFLIQYPFVFVDVRLGAAGLGADRKILQRFSLNAHLLRNADAHIGDTLGVTAGYMDQLCLYAVQSVRAGGQKS